MRALLAVVSGASHRDLNSLQEHALDFGVPQLSACQWHLWPLLAMREHRHERVCQRVFHKLQVAAQVLARACAQGELLSLQTGSSNRDLASRQTAGRESWEGTPKELAATHQ